MTDNIIAGTVVLKAKRDKPVRQRHPWIFSGAIQKISSDVVDGEVVEVTDSNGRWLARGLLNRSSQIQVRLLCWAKDEVIDTDFWRRRLKSAVRLRQNALAFQNSADAPASTAVRLVHAESDYIPGLTVDRYGDFLVMQIGSLGIEKRKEELASLLMDITGCRGVVDRSDGTQRRKERIPPVENPLIAGEAPDTPITIMENGLRYHVDVLAGQKTGFYVDQRENRQRVAAYCPDGRVLNAFSYTGAFAVAALAAGATHVTNVDSSNKSLALGEENLRLNGFDPLVHSESIAGDVFELLRAWREEGLAEGRDSETGNERTRPFDAIILDPPKFAQSGGQVERALRGYKDINLLAMQLSKPGGILATFSCSGLVSADLFQKVLFGAAVDAGRDLQILEYLHQPFDHPTAITFPEGAYLKGFICRVL